MKRPNVLFIMTDQQRWDAVGINGNPAISTPHLDRLSTEGARFTNTFCAASACVPSRACLLTGTYPTVNGVNWGAGQWVRPELSTLPGVLTANGYNTVGVGKMHFFPWEAMCGFQRRVIMDSKYPDHPDEYWTYIRSRGLFDRVIGHHVPGFGKANKAMVSTLDPGDHVDGYVGRRAVKTVKELIAENRSDGKPFFAWISFNGPHDPYDPPEPYAAMYDPKKMPPPRRLKDELDRVPPSVRAETTEYGLEKMTLYGVPDAEVARIKALYYGNVSLIDVWVGRLLDLLRENHLEKDTLVIFTSDHGEYLGDHDLFWKTYLPSDADFKVPLMVRWPGRVPARCVCDDFATGVDVMPTILTAAGLPVPRECHGLDLLAAIDGRRAPRDHAFMYGEPDKWRYRDRHWAYTWYQSQPFDTLYDMGKDPDELNNLCFGVKEIPPQAKDLRARIENWLRSASQP